MCAGLGTCSCRPGTEAGPLETIHGSHQGMRSRGQAPGGARGSAPAFLTYFPCPEAKLARAASVVSTSIAVIPSEAANAPSTSPARAAVSTRDA